MALADRRGDAAPPRPGAGASGRRLPGRAHRAVQARPVQEGPRLLEGQPAEAGAYRGLDVPPRPAGTRRADQRARPADGAGVPPRRAGGRSAGRRSSCRRTSSARSRRCAIGSPSCGPEASSRWAPWPRCATSRRCTSRPCDGPLPDLSAVPGVSGVSVCGQRVMAAGHHGGGAQAAAKHYRGAGGRFAEHGYLRERDNARGQAVKSLGGGVLDELAEEIPDAAIPDG